MLPIDIRDNVRHRMRIVIDAHHMSLRKIPDLECVSNTLALDPDQMTFLISPRVTVAAGLKEGFCYHYHKDGRFFIRGEGLVFTTANRALEHNMCGTYLTDVVWEPWDREDLNETVVNGQTLAELKEHALIRCGQRCPDGIIYGVAAMTDLDGETSEVLWKPENGQLYVTYTYDPVKNEHARLLWQRHARIATLVTNASVTNRTVRSLFGY